MWVWCGVWCGCGVGLMWVGVGVVWVWCRCGGVGMVWCECGIGYGVGLMWVWCGCGVGVVVWVWCGCGATPGRYIQNGRGSAWGGGCSPPFPLPPHPPAFLSAMTLTLNDRSVCADPMLSDYFDSIFYIISSYTLPNHCLTLTDLFCTLTKTNTDRQRGSNVWRNVRGAT